jgi:hypothetical protein
MPRHGDDGNEPLLGGPTPSRPSTPGATGGEPPHEPFAEDGQSRPASPQLSSAYSSMRGRTSVQSSTNPRRGGGGGGRGSKSVRVSGSSGAERELHDFAEPEPEPEPGLHLELEEEPTCSSFTATAPGRLEKDCGLPGKWCWRFDKLCCINATAPEGLEKDCGLPGKWCWRFDKLCCIKSKNAKTSKTSPVKWCTKYVGVILTVLVAFPFFGFVPFVYQELVGSGGENLVPRKQEAGESTQGRDWARAAVSWGIGIFMVVTSVFITIRMLRKAYKKTFRTFMRVLVDGFVWVAQGGFAYYLVVTHQLNGGNPTIAPIHWMIDMAGYQVNATGTKFGYDTAHRADNTFVATSEMLYPAMAFVFLGKQTTACQHGWHRHHTWAASTFYWLVLAYYLLTTAAPHSEFCYSRSLALSIILINL